VLREVILRTCMKIGEIAASTTRYADFLTGCFCMVNDQHGTSAFCSFDGTHHACCTSAYDHDIDCFQFTLLRMAPVHSTPETDETEGFAISNSERGLPESLCAVPVPSDSS